MKNLNLHKLFCLLLVFTFLPAFSSLAGNNKIDKSKIAQNQIIVKYKDASKKESIKNKLKTKKKTKEVKTKDNIKLKEKNREKEAELLEFSQDADFDSVLRELQNDPNVELAEPNYIVTPQRDPGYSNQWGLKNTEQVIFGQEGYKNFDIKIEAVRTLTQGSPDILVAVVDSGMDIAHEDLSHCIYTNQNETADGIDNDGNGFTDDVHGWNFAGDNNNLAGEYEEILHATHIAGVIAADINSKGVEGIAPDVKILPLKFIERGSGFTFDAIRAIQYAENRGASIVNCSWGSYYESSFLKETMESSNMLFVCAAGNDGLSSPMYPSNFGLENVISVTAMDNRGYLAGFANYGGNTTIGAPGVAVYSTAPNNNYTFLDGTSMAAPFVTGVAALLRSLSPSLKNGEIKQRLISTASYSYGLSGKTQANGYVNAAAALQAPPPSQALTDHKIYGDAVAGTGNKIYSAGGYGETGYSNQFSSYDPITGMWYAEASMPAARMHTGAVEASGNLYVIGGYNGQGLTAVEKYSLQTKTWSSAASLANSLYAAGVCADTEKIYVFGGVGPDGYTDAVFSYQISSNYWVQETPLPQAAAYMNAVFLDNKIYLFGGVNETGAMDTIYEYNPQDKTFRQLTGMKHYRHSAGAVALDGQIFILGGSNANEPDIRQRAQSDFFMASVLSSAEVFDPLSNTCTEIVDMPQPRLGFSAFSLSGNLYLSGGWNQDYLTGTVCYQGAKVPPSLTARSGETTLNLQWGKVEGASGYDLEANQEIIQIGGGETTAYNLPGGIAYRVRVRARFGDQYGAWSRYLRTHQNSTMEDAVPMQLSQTNQASETGTLQKETSTAWYRLAVAEPGSLNFTLSGEGPLAFDCYNSEGTYLTSGHTETELLTSGNFSVSEGVYYIKVYLYNDSQQEAAFTLNGQFTPLDASSIPDRVFVNTISNADLEGDPTIQQLEAGYPLKLRPTEYQMSVAPQTPLFGEISPLATTSIRVDSTQLRNNRIWAYQSALTVRGKKDEYHLTLNGNETLTAVVDAPGANEYEIDIYRDTGGHQSASVVRYGSENPDKLTLSEIKTSTSGGQYTVRVEPRTGHGSPDPYTLTLYLSEGDGCEPSYFGTEYESYLISGVGGRTSMYTPLANLAIDNPEDRDFYRLENVNANEKITAALHFHGDAEDRIDKYSYEIWRVKNKVEHDDGWTDYYYDAYRYTNDTLPVAMRSPNMRVLSFVTADVGTGYDATTYYLVVREREKNTVVPAGSYTLSCTKVPLNNMASEDPYERTGDNNVSNDFIIANGTDYSNELPDNQTVSAVIDNQLDIDWFNTTISREETKKSIVLSGTNSNNFDVVVLDKNLNLLAKGNSNSTLAVTFHTTGTYYIGVYRRDFSPTPANQSYSLTLLAGTRESFEISGVSYNNGAGPKLGGGNTVSLSLKKNSAGSGSYKAKLLCAWEDGQGGSKTRDVSVTLSGTNWETVTFDNILFSGGGSGTLYTYVKVYASGSSYGEESNRKATPIVGIMPQEVEFQISTTIQEEGKTKNCYHLFDDHPEHIRPCDIIDDTSYGTKQGTMLAKYEDLGPGIYTVFSYHLISGNYLNFDFNRPQGNTYYDAVFYNASLNNNVKVRSYTILDSHELNNGGEGISGGNYIFNGLTNETSIWLSDILWQNYGIDHVTLGIDGGGGSSLLIMEFEVTEGTVDFGTVAYHNKPTDTTFNGWFKRAPYETLETIKGKAVTTQAITTNLEYYIDDSLPSNQETRLPVTISNIFFDKRKLDFFTTHNSAVSTNNRWSMVGSSTVEHTYEDIGVVNRNGIINVDGDEINAPNSGKWIFNDDYCVDIRGKNIPADARTGYYAGKTNFEPNEQYNKQWLNSLVRDSQGNYNDADLLNNHGTLWSQRQDIFLELQRTEEYTWSSEENKLVVKPDKTDSPCVNPGYGLINEYVLTLHNEGSTDKKFSYLIQGNKCDVSWSVNGGEFETKTVIQATNNTDFVDISGGAVGTEEVFSVNLQPGVTTITIRVKLLNNSNPTVHNAFSIGIPELSNGSFEGTYYKLYPASIYNEDHAINYPQN